MERHPQVADELFSRAEEFALVAVERLDADLLGAESTGVAGAIAPRAAAMVDRGIAHLRAVAVAMSMGRPALLDAHLAWCASASADGPPDLDGLFRHLRAIAEVVDQRACSAGSSQVAEIVAGSLARLSKVGPVPPTASLDPAGPLGGLAEAFLRDLLTGDHRSASRRVLEAVDDGASVEALYLGVFQPTLYELGRLWQIGRISVAQEHLVTAATQVVMAQLYPTTFAAEVVGPSVLVASVGGELHEIGGRMVADVFQLRGWHSQYVGGTTPIDSLVEIAATTQADVVAVSASGTDVLPTVERVVEAVHAHTRAKVLVGGRPFNQVPDLWRVIGADGTATDAVGAVEEATRLLAVVPR